MTSATQTITAMVPQGRGGYVPQATAGQATTTAFNNGNTPSFSDLVDIINPLQHIPVVNTIYRAITGDRESAMADVIGGALYGGPIGAVAAEADLGLRDATGKDAGEHAMAWLGLGGKDAPANPTAVASATPAKTTTSAKQLTSVTEPAAHAAPTVPVTSKPLAQAANPASAPNAAQAPTSLITAATGAGAAAETTAAGAAPVTTTNLAAPIAPTAAAGNAGPSTVGDYLVFGSGAAAAQAPTPTPVSSSTVIAPRSFAAIGNNKPMSAALPLVAGQASATATSTPANGAAPASMAMAPAAATSMPGGPQLASAGIQPKIFPVPPRNGPASPSVALPPPTTGPGALPGGKSLALSAQEMNGQQGEQNFYTSYAQALDKYRAMQQMKGGAAPVTPLAPSAAPAPTMLQPAAAMAPAADADEDATTVH